MKNELVSRKNSLLLDESWEMECDDVGSTTEAWETDARTGCNLWWVALQIKRVEINFPDTLEDPKVGTLMAQPWRPAVWWKKVAAIVLMLQRTVNSASAIHFKQKIEKTKNKNSIAECQIWEKIIKFKRLHQGS